MDISKFCNEDGLIPKETYDRLYKEYSEKCDKIIPLGEKYVLNKAGKIAGFDFVEGNTFVIVLAYTPSITRIDIVISSEFQPCIVFNDIDELLSVLKTLDFSVYKQDVIEKLAFLKEETVKLFKMMQAKKSHMVIVVDEYGQTSGVVAMEDILEEIVGNIEDEHDEEEQLIRKNPDGSYLMNGSASLSDVIETLHLPIEEDSFDTLNGLLVSLLDKIPSDGETAEVHAYGYVFSILKVENKMIHEVHVQKSEEKADEA